MFPRPSFGWVETTEELGGEHPENLGMVTLKDSHESGALVLTFSLVKGKPTGGFKEII